MSVSVWPSTLPVFRINRQPKFAPRSEAVQMETGRLRNRRKYLVPLETIDVTWTFILDQFEIFEEYVHTDLENGSLPFEATTYTPNVNPGLLTEVIREYAFLDSQYLFSRRDNEFEVTATVLASDISTRLILNPGFWAGSFAPWVGADSDLPWEGTGHIPFIPVLDLTMGECNRTLTLAWGDVSPGDSLEIEVETAPGSGIYETLLLLEPEDLAVVDSVTLENDYGGRNIRAHRVVGDFTSLDSDAVAVATPDIAAPTVASFSGASVSTRGTPGLLTHTDAPLLVPEGSYLLVGERYDMNVEASGVGAPTFNLPPGTELRVTSDNSTPTADSPTTPQDPSEESFSGVYRAAAIDTGTGCMSPPLVIALDRTWDLIESGMIFGTAAVSVGGCRGPDFHRFPVADGSPLGYHVVETTTYAGDSCQTLGYPGSIAPLLAIAQAAKDAGNCVPLSSYKRGSSVTTPGVPEPDHGTTPYDDWGGGYTIYESVATIYCYTIFSSALVLRDIPPMNGTVEITYGGETIIIEAPDTSGPGATADAVNAAVDEAMDAAVDPTSADGDLDAFFRLSALP